jgi:hypothetical protein
MEHQRSLVGCQHIQAKSLYKRDIFYDTENVIWARVGMNGSTVWADFEQLLRTVFFMFSVFFENVLVSALKRCIISI